MARSRKYALRGLVYLALVRSGALASPNHDEVQASVEMHTSWQQYTEGRRLGSSEFAQEEAAKAETCELVHSKSMEQIRIGYDIIGVDPGVSIETRNHIEHVILKRAINYWSRTLKVHRASAPLSVSRVGVDCHEYGLGFRDYIITKSPLSCSDAKLPTCGVGIDIPAKYLRPMKVCKTNCPQALETLEHLVTKTGGPPCDDCTELPGGPGAAGVDFMALVTIKQSQFCESRTKAHGSSCVKDQCDRPIFAWINFCPGMVSRNDADTNSQVSTAIHELAHALAFSSHLFGFFRNPDGSPIMPRDEDEPKHLQNRISWTCNAQGYAWNDPAGHRKFVDLSATGIIVKSSERGINKCPCPVGMPFMQAGCIQSPLGFREPKCVFKFALPKVRQEVQNYFDCPYLVGAELENQPTSMCEIVGSHWESRIFMGEVMTAGQFQDYIFLSRVTLALFEDSGWYLPDYEMADIIVQGVHWGYKQGCAFASEACVTNGHTQFPHFWCTNRYARKCSLFRREELQCSMMQSPVPLKPAWNYFGGRSIGDLPEADYCPYYHSVVPNHICTDTVNSAFHPLPNANFMREVFGAESRCLDSTLNGDIGTGPTAWKANPGDFVVPVPSCLKVVCSATASTYDVYVSDLKNGAAKLGTCTGTGDGQKLKVSWLRGEVTCAPYQELCSEGLKGSRHVMQLYDDDSPGGAQAWLQPRWPVVLIVVGVSALSSAVLLVRFGSRVHVAQRDLQLVDSSADRAHEVTQELMEQQPLEETIE